MTTNTDQLTCSCTVKSNVDIWYKSVYLYPFCIILLGLGIPNNFQDRLNSLPNIKSLDCIA